MRKKMFLEYIGSIYVPVKAESLIMCDIGLILLTVRFVSSVCVTIIFENNATFFLCLR